MKFGFVVPYADSREFAELAALGEQHGWDAIFTWEAVYGVDAWVSLAAAAMATERIRLGTLLTPVPRIKPWDLATRVGTVDRLSNGRVVLGAGLGALHEGWTAYEADEGRKVRAEKLDEGLAVYAGLLGGQPFEYAGKHYSAKPNTFMLPDPPVQQPHPPVWVVGAKVVGRDKQPSLARAARWQGLLPVWADPDDPNDGNSGVTGPERMARDRRGRAATSRGAGPAVGGLRRRTRSRQHGRVRQDRAAPARCLGRGRRHLVGRELVGAARRAPRVRPSCGAGSRPARAD